MKAPVLREDKGSPNLVTSSVYDTKRFHFLSMVCQQLKWIVKEKLEFNVDTGIVESLRILELSQSIITIILFVVLISQINSKTHTCLIIGSIIVSGGGCYCFGQWFSF